MQSVGPSGWTHNAPGLVTLRPQTRPLQQLLVKQWQVAVGDAAVVRGLQLLKLSSQAADGGRGCAVVGGAAAEARPDAAVGRCGPWQLRPAGDDGGEGRRGKQAQH